MLTVRPRVIEGNFVFGVFHGGKLKKKPESTTF
jgi:hypothetical protein